MEVQGDIMEVQEEGVLRHLNTWPRAYKTGPNKPIPTYKER